MKKREREGIQSFINAHWNKTSIAEIHKILIAAPEADQWVIYCDPIKALPIIIIYKLRH